MAKLSTDELLEQFKELTLIELSEFVKAFEETFEVTAAAPVAVAAAPAAAMNGGPVLLTRPDSVPAATMTALNEVRAQAVTLVGGFGAISLQVQEHLGEYVYP